MKIFFKLFITILFLIFITLMYLSIFGVETDKFNSQITEKISFLNVVFLQHKYL